jgi:hypothetical protein
MHMHGKMLIDAMRADDCSINCVRFYNNNEHS